MPRIIKLAKGTYTSATVTVDGDGRVISAASGSGGGGTYVTTTFNSPGTFTSASGSNFIQVVAAGGGGGASNQNANTAGNTTNFGTLMSVPGGNATGQSGNQNGSSGTSSNSLWWSIGRGQSGQPQGQGANIGGQQYNNIGALSGAGRGGGGPVDASAGSGGAQGALFNSPQYAPAGVPVTIGTAGAQQGGGDGRVVVVEFVV